MRSARGLGGVPPFDSRDEQDALRAELRKFAANELAPHYAEDDQLARFRRQVVDQLGAMGLLGLRIPEAHGGGAAGWAPLVSVEAAHQALLTSGHVGYSSDLPHGQRLRDVIGLEIGDGTAQIAQLVVARRILGAEFAP